MKLLARLPLYLTFLIIVLTSSLVVSAITYGVQVQRVRQQVVNAQINRVHQRMVELQGTINDFNRRHDSHAIHREIARLSVDPTLKLLLVVDAGGMVRFSSIIDYRGRPVAEIAQVDYPALLAGVDNPFGSTYYRPGNDWVVAAYPLHDAGTLAAAGLSGQPRLLGIFDISLPIQKALYDHELTLLQTVLIYVIFLIIAFVLLYGGLRTRMKRIIDATQTFVGGDYSARVRMEGSDELAGLARTFDHMADEIEQQHGSLQQLAHFDNLTRLPNRNQFLQRLERVIGQGGMSSFSLLFIDLDRFKVINDTLGHQLGDELLQVIAHRLSTCIKEHDLLARFGGDEFLILLEQTASHQQVVPVLQRVLAHVAEPMLLNGHPVSTTASVGVARYPQDGRGAQELIQHADIAMYQAKAQGKNRFYFYQPGADELSPDSLGLEHHLKQCVANGEITVLFQPVHDIGSRSLTGFEALARLHDRNGRMLLPDTFLPVLEEAGLMVSFGMTMLKRSIQAYLQWLGKQSLPVESSLAVNVACMQLDQPDFLQQLDKVLAESGMAPQQLELEITESTVISQIEQKMLLLQEIRNRGIRIAIDDFGTGYSSLSYLKKLPIDKLKIDLSFVRDINLDRDDDAIIEAIIAMASKLNLKVVAEGVETEQQLAFLRDRGCHFAQGYYFGRPSVLLSEASESRG